MSTTDWAPASLAPTDPRPTVDLLDPELYQRDPHDVWTWMRANEPIYRDERNGLWAITRHAHLMEVERRSSVFVSGQGYRAIWSPEEVNMIAQDDPRHRQQRMLVQGRFTGKAVAERRAEIDELTAQLIDAALAEGDEFEVVDALAGQLPARLTARLLGFPEEMWPHLRSWSERLMRTDMRERSGAIFSEFIDANMEFAGALGEIAQAKFLDPGDDLISTWIHAEIDGERLPPEAIVHEVGLFIAGGAETTRTAIAHGLRAFCDHPDQWDAIATEPSLVPGAVEEVLRWVTPLNNMFRRAAVDAQIGVGLEQRHGGGPHDVARGDRIIMLYPSANRDEAVFDDPFRFDVRRASNPHVAFGFGTHLCIGTHVARATLASLFGQLAARVTGLRVVEEPDVEANIFARAVRSFTLGVTRR